MKVFFFFLILLINTSPLFRLEAEIEKDHSPSANFPDLPQTEPLPSKHETSSSSGISNEESPELSLENLPKMEKKDKIKKEIELEKEEKQKKDNNWLFKGVEEQKNLQKNRDQSTDDQRTESDQDGSKLKLDKNPDWLLHGVNEQKKAQEKQKEENLQNNKTADSNQENTDKEVKGDPFSHATQEGDQHAFRPQISLFSHYTTSGLDSIKNENIDLPDKNSSLIDSGKAENRFGQQETISHGSSFSDYQQTKGSDNQDTFKDVFHSEPTKSTETRSVSGENYLSPAAPSELKLPSTPQAINIENNYMENLRQRVDPASSKMGAPYAISPSKPIFPAITPASSKARVADPNDFLGH